MEAKFLELIKDVFEIDGDTPTMTDVFRDLDGWDSLTRLSLIAMIDEEYDVVIEDDTFKKLLTLEDLFKAIQERSNA